MPSDNSSTLIVANLTYASAFSPEDELDCLQVLLLLLLGMCCLVIIGGKLLIIHYQKFHAQKNRPINKLILKDQVSSVYYSFKHLFDNFNSY